MALLVFINFNFKYYSYAYYIVYWLVFMKCYSIRLLLIFTKGKKAFTFWSLLNNTMENISYIFFW